MVKQRLWAAALALVLLLTSLVLGTLVSVQETLATATSTTVEVDKIALSVGNGGSVAIRVKNITDPAGLGACLFTITYNPAVIRVNGVLAGDPPFNSVPTFNVVGGKVILYTDQASRIPGPTGDIVVARLDVTAIAAGSTDLVLAINPGGLINTSGQDISTVVVNGQVTVLGSAAKLAFTTQPSSSNTAGTAFGTQPVVGIQDAAGNTVNSTAAVTLAITQGTGTSGAVLSGTKTVNAVNGLATFSGLSINLTGSGYTLTASSGTLTPATSSAFNVAGAAAKLAFTTQPSGSNTAGTAFATQPVVAIQDANGSTVTTSTATVTLAITTGTGSSGAVLSGTKTVNAVNGVATFSGLSINLAGSGYTLRASSGTLTPATSSYFNVVAGAAAAAKLAFTTQPSSSNMVGTALGTQPVVTVQDSNGNTVTTSTALVTLAIGTNPGGGTLSGTKTVTVSSGVATFSGLSINLAGTYTLTATSSGLASATSSYFNVVTGAGAGAAAKLAFIIQPSSSNTVGTALGTQPVVTIQDWYGNTVTTSTAWVTLAITPGTGTSGAALLGNTTVYAANGMATFSGLSINLAGTYTLTATSSGLASATSSYFNVVAGAGAAAKLAFTTQPSYSNTAGTAFSTQPVVVVQDLYGNWLTTSTASVTVAITPGTGTSGATLSGTKTVYAVNGVATFSGLSINLPGTYTLTVTRSGMASATSSYFNVMAGAAKLAFTTQPSVSNTAGTAFGTQLVVTVQDANGNWLTTSTASVTVAITPGTGTSGAALSGNITVYAANGMATFSGLSIDKAGTGYKLRASSGTLTPATSSAFNVVAGAAAKLAFTTQPRGSNKGGTALGTQPVVTVQDAVGNTVTTSTAAVTLAITSGAGTSGAVLSGTAPVNAVNGVATFSGLSINLAGSDYTLTASSGTLTPATSSAFYVVAGAAVTLAFTTQPGSSNTGGTAFAPQPVVTIQDWYGNTVTTSAALVTVTITSGTGTSGAALSGTTTVPVVNGVATFSGLSINLAGTGYTLRASSGTLTPATSSAFNVVAVATPTPTPLPTPIPLDLSAKIDEKGVVQEDIEHPIVPGQVVLDVPKGTTVLTAEGMPLQSITAEEVSLDGTPSPPEAHIIGFAYLLGPEGATFDPAITITMKYDRAAVPQGVAENDLILAYYDVASSTWKTLSDIVVDTVNHTVSGKAIHFTLFSVLAPTPTSTATPTPTETPTPPPMPTSEEGGKGTNVWVIIAAILFVALAALVYFFVIRPAMRRKKTNRYGKFR